MEKKLSKIDKVLMSLHDIALVMLLLVVLLICVMATVGNLQQLADPDAAIATMTAQAPQVPVAR